MSTSGSVAGNHQKVPKEACGKKRLDMDNNINLSPKGVVVSSQGIKLLTPIRFLGKKGILLDFLN